MTDSKASWQFYTIPNMLSVLRIMLIGPIIYCILHESRTYFYAGIVMIFIAALTDFLDGILARRLNQISEFGKLLDPLADKLSVAALVIVLIFYRDFPVWVAALIIGRDVLIAIAGLIFASKHKFLMSSNFIGKLTATLYAFMILAYILEISVLENIFTIFAVVMTFVSAISYTHRFIVSLNNKDVD
ncbi:MAG: CDP-diacylglycerol--glycerol-3-phosphate 3-phosphatidyltransferase [candidate division KSB1 bacterium]|jgi:CDP-diacylglycerol--glycerol-3-phosphate 3-phosphatidyltransferase|nr:CDP-diacylglycerol--glycerol-3-phosphate 3-phosphatidyltransferase [candidate division KSB1 bacterium]